MTKVQSKRFPNAVIIGAPKSGTSSLFFWLSAHPEVCGSKTKETYFLADGVSKFNRGLNLIENGLDAYTKHFEHCQGEAIRLEATAPYIYMNNPFKVLPSLETQPKIIIILRKPSERLYSHYKFNRYRMKNIDMSFEEYLNPDNIPEGWQDYLEQTDYPLWIEKWQKAVGKDRLLVYQMEEMHRDKVQFMMKVASDLGINPEFYDGFDFFHRNKTVAVKSKKLHRLGLKFEPLVPQWLQEKIIPLYLKMNSSKVPPITAREKELKEQVTRNYSESIHKLKTLVPTLDLSLWE